MAQVERASVISQQTKVQRHDPLGRRTPLVGVVGKLQSRATEAVLLHEDAGIADGDFEGQRGLGGVEAGAGHVAREEEDVGPGEVVALDVARVEGVPAAAEGGVEVGEGGVGGDAAVEDEGAGCESGGGCLVEGGVVGGGCGGEGEGGKEGEEGEHCEGVNEWMDE